MTLANGVNTINHGETLGEGLSEVDNNCAVVQHSCIPTKRSSMQTMSFINNKTLDYAKPRQAHPLHRHIQTLHTCNYSDTSYEQHAVTIVYTGDQTTQDVASSCNPSEVGRKCVQLHYKALGLSENHIYRTSEREIG